MISHLKGILEHIDKDHISLDVNGVGYKVHISTNVLNKLPKPGTSLNIFTFQVVRENDISLFGFLNKEERNLFSTLLKVSGVGPKAASAILSCAPLDKLVSAITRGDADLLASAPGIGKKTAQKVVIELKEKIAKAYGLKAGELKLDLPGESPLVSEAVQALMALGYSPKEAKIALQDSKVDLEKAKNVEEVIKSALKALV